MMNRTGLTMGVLVAVVLAGSVALGNNKWTGNGGDNLWNNPDNWQKGIPDPTVDVRCQIDGPDIEVLIDATHVGDEEALNEEIRVSYTSDKGAVTLTVDGGTLRCTDRLFLAAREETTGTVVVDGGGQVIASRITLGRIGAGVIILNDGLVDCSTGQVEFGLNVGSGTLILNGGSFKALGFLGSNNGRIELNGGVLEVASLTLGAVTVDITDGTLIVAGDQTAVVQADAQAGFITTFGQDGSRGGLIVTYDADLDQTVVTADAAQMDLSKAWRPAPSGQGAPVESVLSWKAGDFTAPAQGHDVYFGTDAADVEAATVGDSMGVYEGRQDANSYDPGQLTLGQTYYWRVDQVLQDSGDVRKGDVWSFTIQATWMIDDFNGYADWEAVLEVWEEQGSAFNWVSTTFAAAGNSLGVDLKPEEGLTGAMVMRRDMDLTAYGVRALAFDFASDPNQGFVQAVYVELADAVNTARVTIDDPVVVHNRAWGLVEVDLGQFAGVDLTQIKSLALGVTLSPSGTRRVTVYFDQLRLFPQRCVPERTLASDLNGDCLVDAEDLTILTDRWLEGTIEIVAAEPLSQPAVWHTFDRVNNTTLGFDDEMGLAPAAPSAGAGFIPQGGYDGLGAVAFTGDQSYLDVDSAVFSGIAGPALTISLWVYGDPAFQPFANDAVFHGSGAGGFTMQLMCPDSQGRVVFDHGGAPADRVVWSEANPADWEGQWNHYAVVKDAAAGTQQIYHNGRLVAENTSAFQSTPNSGGMRIGATNQPTPQRLYHGKVDEFRMYAAVLPQAAILYLADGTQIDQAPVTPADINRDGVVDQADRDILEANMGKVQMWP
ncbi:MAG: LamG domain-containing protein [Sedimentisphaerales bacterium]|nr:LamG domain-containing protein [Sedimentisphaerales bacterium]